MIKVLAVVRSRGRKLASIQAACKLTFPSMRKLPSNLQICSPFHGNKHMGEGLVFVNLTLIQSWDMARANGREPENMLESDNADEAPIIQM